MADIDIRSGLSEEERARLEKIDRIDSNKKRKKLIMAAVTVVLILFFVGGTIFGAVHILSFEGTQALPEEKTQFPVLPEGEDEILSSLNSLINEVCESGSEKLDTGVNVALLNESIEITGEKAEEIKPVFDYVLPSATDILSSLYEDERHKGTYGEDFSSLIFDTSFTSEDAEISLMISEENENDLKYVLNFPIDEEKAIEEQIIYDIFSMEITKKVKEDLYERFSSMVKTGDVKISYKDFSITADIERLTEKLRGIEQKRALEVVLPLTFIGEYEDFGEITISFELEIIKSFIFTRIEFFFREDVFYIEKGSTDEFKTKVISDQSPSEIEIELISSDPSVLSIDKGFYKGEKPSKEPVTVTGRYTYNGVTYEDTCLFYVRVPVDGVKVNEKEAALNVGEAKKIEITLSPEDATLTDVYWFTTDESIVKVDENGNAVGVKAGFADVYCITSDGNYKSSCHIEVK